MTQDEFGYVVGRLFAPQVFVLCESCWEALPPALRLKYYGKFQGDPIWPQVKAAVLEGK